jgi:hypothetical protein
MSTPCARERRESAVGVGLGPVHTFLAKDGRERLSQEHSGQQYVRSAQKHRYSYTADTVSRTSFCSLYVPSEARGPYLAPNMPPRGTPIINAVPSAIPAANYATREFDVADVCIYQVCMRIRMFVCIRRIL